MKKLLLFAFAVLAFAACTQNDVEELSANRADVPETLTVGFEGDDDTRIQFNKAQKSVWNAGDEVSVFYKSYDNLKWQFQGETGDRSGALKMVDGEVGAQTMGHVVVVYPYSTSYKVSDGYSGIEAILPATQTYLNGSYGEGGNIMVAQSEFTTFTLKNVCGWLRVDLTGDGEKVQHIKFSGNNDEQIAGLVYIDTETAEATLATEVGGYDDEENSVGGGLMFEDSIFTEITLSCGEGVALGSTAKSFYIGLLPQTFEKGITVEVECDNGTSITKSTSEPITIERNHIKPMEAIEYDGVLPEVYELAYRTNDGKPLDPITTEGFGGEFEENIFDAATGEGKLVFAGAVTTIPNQAFGLCENLTWIEIPLGVTSIGVSAFSGCSSMVEITIPASVTSVGSEAFVNCAGKAYINCSGVSFSGAGFAEVVIGDSVTTIGRYAFSSCDSLTSVTIGDSVTTIGEWAFYDCDSLTEFNGKFASEDGRCLIVDGTLNSFAPAGLTSYTIPDSVTTIGDGAFAWCTSLTSVTIPDSVTTIGEDAFHFCDSLTSVTIGDNVTTIGEAAFCGCGLTSVTIGNSVTTIGYEAFYICYSLTSVTIGDSVTTIGDCAFYNCSSLTSVCCEATTPPSLGGSSVFDNNASGRKIYVPEESVRQYKFAEGWNEYTDAIVGFDFSLPSIINYTTSDGQIVNARLPIISNTYSNGIGTIEFWGSIIPVEAFYNCDSLTSVTIGDSVTTIGDYAFYDCNRLTSVTIGDSVTTIGEWAFYKCDSLTSVYCEATTPPSLGGSSVFDNNASGRTIYVPAASVEAYKTAEYWSEYADYIVGYDFLITSIINYTTYDGQIVNASLPIISNTYSNGIGTIEFLGSIIHERAFYDCDSLTSVTIGDSVTTIGEWAFYDCDSLTSVIIPDSVTTIGEWAFSGCSSLTSITIPDSVTTIGDSAFTHCNSLTSIIIPDSVTTIGDSAFYDCDNLTSVTIGDSVTTIGDHAFYECSSLTSVYCEATTPPSLGGGALFANNASGRTIYVPAASVEAYKTAEYWYWYDDYIIGYDFETVEITKPSINLGVCGTFTNWGGILDIEMEYLEDRNLYVAYGIELTTDDCFKLRSNNDWYGRYNIGASYYGYVAYPNCLTEVINGLNSQDIFVAESGTYDIYINLDTMELYFMVEGLDIFEEEEEFEPTHIANECMWGGYSSISWGNYYNVQGENFSLELHFCTDVALESSIAAGEYEWVTNSAITNSNPEHFSTRSFTVNGNSVAVDSGKATVKVSGEEYTINLTLDGRDGNTYCIQYVGKLNVRCEEPNEGGDDSGNDAGDPNTITLNTFVYNADLRGNYYGYKFNATGDNASLGICIGSKSCSPSRIDAGDYTYNQYPEDLPFAFQLRGSNVNGIDVSNDPNATMNVAVNGGVYTITIVTNGYTLTYNGTL